MIRTTALASVEQFKKVSTPRTAPSTHSSDTSGFPHSSANARSLRSWSEHDALGRMPKNVPCVPSVTH